MEEDFSARDAEEVTQKVQPPDEDKEEAVAAGSEREILIDGNSAQVNGDRDDDGSRSSSSGGSEEVLDATEKKEEEAEKDSEEAHKEGVESNADASHVQPAVAEDKSPEEKTESPCLDETNTVDSPGSEQSPNPTQATEEIPITVSSGENDQVPPAVTNGIEETKLPAPADSGGEPSSADKTHQHDATPNLEEPPSPAAESSRVAEENPNREISGKEPIISLKPTAMRQTSWMSCCGLFEVLRRSDR